MPRPTPNTTIFPDIGSMQHSVGPPGYPIQSSEDFIQAAGEMSDYITWDISDNAEWMGHGPSTSTYDNQF